MDSMPRVCVQELGMTRRGGKASRQGGRTAGTTRESVTPWAGKAVFL